MLMEAGRYTDALDAYQLAMTRTPNRFNSLFGAARAAEAVGDRATAQRFFQQILDIVTEDADSPRVAYARAFMSHT